MRTLLVALITGAILAAGAIALASGPPPGRPRLPAAGRRRRSASRRRRSTRTDHDSEGAGSGAPSRRPTPKARPHAFGDAKRKAEAMGATAGMRPRRGLGGRPGPERAPTTAAASIQGTFGGNDYCGRARRLARTGCRRYASSTRPARRPQACGHRVRRRECRAPERATARPWIGAAARRGRRRAGSRPRSAGAGAQVRVVRRGSRAPQRGRARAARRPRAGGRT